ncbi:hypothetical protein [Streptomyces sp. SJL17-1]|uniref:hypothetical protein n=1 Tax=Streptomyces sp. SJL17-1 TaxID=2967223 RepID=UPI002966A202|nr:hypothetical protein [Streptomyces sp. SJL17-1]
MRPVRDAMAQSSRISPGEVVRVKASSVRSGYDPCPICRAEGYKQRAAARRADAAEATALMRAHGFEPLEPYVPPPGGHEVHLRLTGVRTGKGCRMCATHGIDLTGEVWAMVEEETRRAPGTYAPRAGVRPRAAFMFDAETAAAERRALGYEPLVPVTPGDSP